MYSQWPDVSTVFFHLHYVMRFLTKEPIMKNNLVFALFLLLGLAGCKIDSKAPERLSSNTITKPEESYISLPISINAEEIQALLQQAINENSTGDQLFFERGRSVGNGVTIQTIVKKRGDVSVHARNNNIDASLPLHVDLRADWEACQRIDFFVGSKNVCVRHHEDTSAQFTVKVKLSPRLNNEYKLEPNLDLDYSLDRPVQIRIGPIEINLVSKTREALDQHIGKFQTKLDASLQGTINAKAHAQRAWDLTQKPIRLSKVENVWLMTDVSSLHATPFFTSDNAAHLGVAIKGGFILYAGTPEGAHHTKPLPPLQTSLPSTGSVLNVPVIVSYPELEIQANNRLKDFKINYEGNIVTVKKVTIYGTSNGKLVVGADVNLKAKGDWFGTNGWVYLLGNPVYNSSNQEIAVKGVKYDVNTESAIVNAAAWALSPYVQGKIEEALVLNVSDKLNSAKELANNSIKDVAIDKIGRLTGSLSTFEIGDLSVQGDSIRILAKARGTMKLQVTKF